jgi:predicted nucleic acid-binding Zn ribbon protein
MPMFDYVCHDCGAVEEVHVKYPHVAPAKRECKCGAMAVRQFPTPHVIQTGYKPGDARYGRGKGQ